MASTAAGSPVVINGWKIYAHPLFINQLEALMAEVGAQGRTGSGWWGSQELKGGLPFQQGQIDGLGSGGCRFPLDDQAPKPGGQSL